MRPLDKPPLVVAGDVPVVVGVPRCMSLWYVALASLAPPENPVFGVPVDVAVQRSVLADGIELPTVFRQCIDFLEERGVGVVVYICVSEAVGVYVSVLACPQAWSRRDSTACQV